MGLPTRSRGLVARLARAASSNAFLAVFFPTGGRGDTASLPMSEVSRTSSEHRGGGAPQEVMEPAVSPTPVAWSLRAEAALAMPSPWHIDAR